jgi:hypothetical protein
MMRLASQARGLWIIPRGLHGPDQLPLRQHFSDIALLARQLGRQRVFEQTAVGSDHLHVVERISEYFQVALNQNPVVTSDGGGNVVIKIVGSRFKKGAESLIG